MVGIGALEQILQLKSGCHNVGPFQDKVIYPTGYSRHFQVILYFSVFLHYFASFFFASKSWLCHWNC